MFFRRFFEYLEKRLGILQRSDWYSITVEDVANLGGETVLVKYYNHSLSEALVALFPEWKWEKFRFSAKGIWRDETELKRVMEGAKAEFRIGSPDDWYRVSVKELMSLPGANVIVRNGGLLQVLLLLPFFDLAFLLLRSFQFPFVSITPLGYIFSQMRLFFPASHPHFPLLLFRRHCGYSIPM